jgi:hypothetical protein
MIRHSSALLVVAAIGCVDAEPGPETLENDLEQASLLAGSTRLPSTVRGCFVLGPGPSPVTQAQIDKARADITEWSAGDTALRFTWSADLATFHDLTIGGATYRTSCNRDRRGELVEELRLYVDHRAFPPSPVQLPQTLSVPGCTYNEGIGSQAEDPVTGQPIQVGGMWQVEAGYMWSMFPQEIVTYRQCLYTTHLIPDAQRNNHQHESGHALGFAHEQLHGDQNCLAPPAQTAGYKLTNYDRDSVMHYVMTCIDGTTTVGNWGDTGPSASDKLAMEMMYPTTLESRINGSLVQWAGGDAMQARSNLVMRGAYINGAQSALRDFAWRVDGYVISYGVAPSAYEMAWGVGLGTHTLSLEYRDPWGVWHVGSTKVELLPTKTAYMNRVASAIQPMF